MPLIADNARALYASLVIFAIVVAGLVLGRDVLIPLAISASLAFILSPIVAWLVARRVPHGLAVPGLVVTVVLALAGLTAVFSAQVVSLAGELSTYQANLVQKVRTLAEAAKSEGALKRAAESLAALEKNITSELKQQETVPATTGQQRVVVAVDGSSAGAVVRHVSTLLHPLAQTGLVLLFTLFILLQSQDLRDRVARVAGTDNLSATTSALSDAADRLSQLFLTQAAMNIAFGTVIGMLLWAIGVPNSALWGSLTIVMRFVPFIGSLIAAIPPVLLAAAVEPGWGMALAALAIFVVAEPLMGHVIEPLVLGPKAGLSLFAMLAARESSMQRRERRWTTSKPYRSR